MPLCLQLQATAFQHQLFQSHRLAEHVQDLLEDIQTLGQKERDCNEFAVWMLGEQSSHSCQEGVLCYSVSNPALQLFICKYTNTELPNLQMACGPEVCL